MKTRIILFCVIVLAFCLWLLLRHSTEQERFNPNKTAAALTNKQLTGQPQQLSMVKEPQDIRSNVPRPVPYISAEVQSNRIERSYDPWRTPINFYGRVIDESNNSVAGTSINFGWTDLSSQGYSRASTTSDANGMFALEGKKGKHLSVWVNKDGYYLSKSNLDSFFYADNSGNNFVADRFNPVIFYLRKKGAGENLIHVKQNYRIARDGTLLGIDLTTGKAVTGGTGDFVVQCWTDDQGKRSGQKYDWHCLITIPNGGLILSNEEFPFLAPENGYSLTNEIAMPADRPDWKDEVDLKFFYRISNGNYGRMTFSMIAGGDHFCMIDSVLNPSGSRNLESR